MNRHHRTGIVLATLTLAGATTVASTASAVEPPVNTGGTSFMDGFGDPRGSGLSYMQYARFSTAGSIKDQSGNNIPVFVNPRLNVFASLNQFLYTFKTDISGAHPGVYTIIPLVALNSSFGAGGASLQDNGFGMGDALIGSYLQFATITTGGRPLFAHRADMAVQAP